MELFHFKAAVGVLPLVLSAALQTCCTEEERDFMASLYLKHRKELFTFALRFCGKRPVAEDAIQDTFLSLIPKVSELRAMETERLTGYLFLSVKNSVRKILRKEERMTNAEMRSIAESDEAPVIPLPGYAYEDLMDALPHLSERDQAILQMKYFLQQSDEEMAEQLHVKASSVRMLVKRARQRLVGTITKEGGQ